MRKFGTVSDLGRGLVFHAYSLERSRPGVGQTIIKILLIQNGFQVWVVSRLASLPGPFQF